MIKCVCVCDICGVVNIAIMSSIFAVVNHRRQQIQIIRHHHRQQLIARIMIMLVSYCHRVVVYVWRWVN
jgi:hypothetical protein